MDLETLLFFRFDKYPEDNAAAAYGLSADDHFGDAFPDFDYTNNDR